MSKKTKRLVILAGLLIVLVAVYAGITIVNRRNEEQAAKEAKEAENGILVGEMDQEAIMGFSYQHPHSEEFSDTVYVFSKQGSRWYYKDDMGFPVNDTVLQTKLEDLSKVYAKRLLEESDENFAAYGLDEPALIVSVTDGRQTITYNIGNYNESTADYYMNIEGTDQVYTVGPALWVAFGMELYDMVQMEKFPEIQEDHITHMNITTKDQVLDFTFEKTGTETENSTGKVTNTGEWYIEDGDGNRVKAHQSRTTALISSIVGLSYVQEVNYHCEESQLGTYGLAEPNAVITIDYTVDQVDYSTVEKIQVAENVDQIQYETNEVQKQLVLSIGDPTDTFTYTDDYYVTTSEGGSILTIETIEAETFMTLKRDDFLGVPSTIPLVTEEAATE